MIYIACPANCYTGGPTLLHQLCFELNRIGAASSMAYYQGAGSALGNPVHQRYRHFDNPFVLIDEVEDISKNWLIVPETGTHLIKDFKTIQIAIWWLSVDNYILGNLNFLDKVRSHLGKNHDISTYIHRKLMLERPVFYRDDLLHLAQSQYAIDFLTSLNVPIEKIRYLSDYLDDSFILSTNTERNFNKKDIILYNPKKMGILTANLLRSKYKEQMIPLENMNQMQLTEIMCTAKVYVDFGNHPGKDRLPRETALCGCCVITGKRGSAGNQKDVPIPNRYKFSDKAPLNLVEETIADIFLNYNICRDDFNAYRELIKSEHATFLNDLSKIYDEFWLKDIN